MPISWTRGTLFTQGSQQILVIIAVIIDSCRKYQSRARKHHTKEDSLSASISLKFVYLILCVFPKVYSPRLSPDFIIVVFRYLLLPFPLNEKTYSALFLGDAFQRLYTHTRQY